MKTTLAGLTLALIVAAGQVHADDIRVKATRYDISDNLDLRAVASLFGESKNLQDFEEELNDPRNGISNLDLNEDGYVDYLRVVELSENREHLICIQAVLGDDLFQDVATLEIDRDEDDHYSVLIIGNSFIYGPEYYIRPVYYRRPFIFSFFYGPMYRPWHSPYYWGYYPYWYKHRRPYPVYRYHRNINIHINAHNHYDYPVHVDHHPHQLYNKMSRNDYGTRHPDRSFERRQAGYKNHNDIENNRRSQRTTDTPTYRQSEKSGSNQEVNRRDGQTRDRRSSESPAKMKSSEPTRTVKESPERTTRRSSDNNSGSSYKQETRKESLKSITPEKKTEQRTSRSESQKRETPVKASETKTEKPKAAPVRTEKKSETRRNTESTTRRSEKTKTSAKEKTSDNTRR